MKIWAFLTFSLLLSFFLGGSAEQCGTQAGGATCPGGLCCSQWGWCGNTSPYCGPGCQSQCGGGGVGGDLASIISSSTFDQMLGGCRGKGFYTYDAFLAAAKSVPGFGTTGDVATRKREIAAFFGQISDFGNYNYGQCERAIGVYLLNNPDLVAKDPVISFKTAIRFWMTPQSPKPSCHDVITRNGLLDLGDTI